MTQSRVLDTFVVINGPEDGAEFTVSRSPIDVGSDGSANIVLRLDDGVELKHCHLNAENGGYRVRGMGKGRAYVNGKRVGLVRSRIAKDGHVIQIGNTMMVLECAPDGLASRNRGVGAAADLLWAIRTFATESWRAVSALSRLTWEMLRSFYSSWLAIGIILAIVYFTVPAFKYRVDNFAGWVRYHATSVLNNVTR